MITIAQEFQDVARIGVLDITGLCVRESPEELKAILNSLVDKLAEKYRNQSLGNIPTVREIRKIFHRSGLDPTRYRPSSESLLRRAVKGKGLTFINSAVDLVNYLSLQTLWPMGLYNADRLRPPIVWRIGRREESYEGIGRNRLNLERFPLLADAEGPFGSPISDSTRTCVTEDCTHILWITFAAAGTDIPLEEFSNTMIRFNGGEVLASFQL